MAKYQGRRGEDETRPNLTPMLDIVFIMLIFFIVTASFVHEEGIGVGRVEGTPPVNNTEQPNLTFRLLADYRIEHEGRLVDLWSAEALMKRFHTEHPKLPVAIKLEDGARHRTMVRLVDLAYRSGLPRGHVIVQ